MEVPDSAVVPFMREVSDASDGLPLSFYETLRAKKALSIDVHRAVKEAVPDYLMVKANAGTVGATPEGCEALSEFVNVFVSETKWTDLGHVGIRGCCSAMVYWNPRLTLTLWDLLRRSDWEALQDSLRPVIKLHEFLGEHFEPKGFTDTAYDRMCGVATGFLPMSLRSRGPYPSATESDVEEFRAWCRAHFPEMLEL
jgi:dihydrodipicolinate synthase/N-acetylneuraminate lyase